MRLYVFIYICTRTPQRSGSMKLYTAILPRTTSTSARAHVIVDGFKFLRIARGRPEWNARCSTRDRGEKRFRRNAFLLRSGEKRERKNYSMLTQFYYSQSHSKRTRIVKRRITRFRDDSVVSTSTRCSFVCLFIIYFFCTAISAVRSQCSAITTISSRKNENINNRQRV